MAIIAKTFYWRDYETTSVNPAKDRASKFAGLRTDWELNVIGELLGIHRKLQEDILPYSAACIITGISVTSRGKGLL